MRSLTSFFLLFCIFVSYPSFAQNETKEVIPDPRLKDYYPKEQLDKMVKNAPAMVEYMNFFLDNAYFITEIPPQKKIEAPYVEIKDFNNININALGLKREQNTRTYYKIAGTSKMLVCYSNEEFTKKFNEHTGRTVSK